MTIPSPNYPDRVGVVGGGLAGLAAACTLAARGHAVTVFERSSWLGGKAAVLERGGFRFDMGPTILTVPAVLRRIFAEAGRDLDRELDLVRLDPQWRCFFDDGSVLDLHQDPAQMAGAIERFTPDTHAGDGYRKLIEISARLHRISEDFFFWRPVEDLRDTFDRKRLDLRTLRDVLALRLGQSVAANIRSLVDDSRVAQMLDHFTQYVGSSPFQSPAVLLSIAHMQTEGGVWYPRGGIGAVPRALANLARELGVELRTGVGVRRVLHRDGRVHGVETDTGEAVRLRAVVSNMDVVRTHDELIGAAPAERFRERWGGVEPACSGVVLYLGLRERYRHLLHHNFVFSNDPHQEFEWIYRHGEPAPDPTCYVAAPASTEPGVAPPGGEALYVLVHAPYLRDHHDWREMYPRYRRVILDKLARCGGMPDLEQRIVVEEALTPQDIHERYSVLRGAIYGLASHGTFWGAFKPGNRSRDLEGLYLAGGSAHPGPGMPMVLMSGWIAADALDRDVAGARELRRAG